MSEIGRDDTTPTLESYQVRGQLEEFALTARHAPRIVEFALMQPTLMHSAGKTQILPRPRKT